jgi:hypothetical protein
LFVFPFGFLVFFLADDEALAFGFLAGDAFSGSGDAFSGFGDFFAFFAGAGFTFFTRVGLAFFGVFSLAFAALALAPLVEVAGEVNIGEFIITPITSSCFFAVFGDNLALVSDILAFCSL